MLMKIYLARQSCGGVPVGDMLYVEWSCLLNQ